MMNVEENVRYLYFKLASQLFSDTLELSVIVL